jgi:hypothetical protein
MFFFNICLYNLPSGTQMCPIGQKCCLGILCHHPWPLATLMTLHSYPTSHHSHSSVTKNGQKLFINLFCSLLPSDGPFLHIMGQQMVSSPPLKPPKVPFTSTIPHRYPIGYHSHLSVTKNGKKTMKKDVSVFLHP